MRVAQVRVDERASTVLALACDGELYDVDRLEAAWGISHPLSGRDFRTRVVSAGGEGLDELDARLRRGPRPSSARLPAGSYLPLPPCDLDRAAYLQLAPYGEEGRTPSFEHRDARGLLGDTQPVPFFGSEDSLSVEVGGAVVLGDDLWQADAREAERAILGLTLVLDWSRHGRSWSERLPCPASPSQIGPLLAMRQRLRDLGELEVTIDVGGRTRRAGRLSDWSRPPADTLAWMSKHLPLRAGDVIGLGCLRGGHVAPGEIRFEERVLATLKPLMRLGGWAAASRR